MKAYSGLTRVGYSDTKASTITYLSGKFGADSTINPEVVESETTVGVLHGGDSASPEIQMFDRTDYDTLEGFMTEDTEKFWHLEYQDGREYVTKVATNIMITEQLNPNARDGVSPMTLRFVRFYTEPLFELKAE